jgi:hypothetical protein
MNGSLSGHFYLFRFWLCSDGKGKQGFRGTMGDLNLLSFLKNYCLELLDLNVQCKLIVSRGFGFSGLN